MLESPGEEAGEGTEAGRAEAGGDGQHRGEGCTQASRGAGGDRRFGADPEGREEATQPRINPTSQRRAQARQVWDEGVRVHGQGPGGRVGKGDDKGHELYTILYTNARSVLNKIDQLIETHRL